MARTQADQLVGERPDTPREAYRLLPATTTAVIVTALAVLAAAGWVYAVREADSMSGMVTGLGQVGGGMRMGMGVAAFLAMWAAMMVAMMAPTLAPVTLAHRAALRTRGGGVAPTAAFVTGFLVVWAAAGIVALAPYRLILELPASAAHSRWLPTLAGAALVAIGAYQYSPWKTHCLRMCRRPLASVGGVDVCGTVPSAFRAGALHGVHCLGCCWALMVILLVAGVMNLVWMAVIALVFLVDKHWERGEGFSRAVGIGLVLLGLAVIVAPDLLPWISGVDINGPIDMTDMGGM